MLPLVALVGRPNVGKSTLFNALTRSRDALVADRPGVTRDRQYGICRRVARVFSVVDTGGLTDSSDTLAGLTTQQAETAISESDLVVLLVDAREGLLPQDRNIVDQLRRSGKQVFLAVNKTDGVDAETLLADFSQLGLATMFAIAASHQRGVPALVDAIVAALPVEHEATPEIEPDRIRLAIVGRPNVGKSTLVNRLLGEERVIVSELPGTTRDAIAVDLERDDHKYRLIDTAGVRRRARVEDPVEKFSVLKTLAAIESAQVVALLLDGAEGVNDQDATLLGQVLDSGRALIVAVNKWDGLDAYQRQQCKTALDRRLTFVDYAPIVFISAKHGSGLRELFTAIHRSHASAMRQLSTSELTRALEIAYEAFQPPLVRGHVAKLRFAHPSGINPPTVVIHGSRVATLPNSYKRYLEGFLRKRFKLVGTPLRLEFRTGANPYEGRKNEISEKQQQQRRRLIRHVKRR